MRTETTTIYIAYDGTEFRNKKTCELYEKANLLDRISSECIFLDSDQKPVSTEEFFDDPESIFGIYVPNAEQAKIIHQILEENKLDSPWDECDCYTSGFYWYNYNDNWENVLIHFVYWKNIYNSFQEA